MVDVSDDILEAICQGINDSRTDVPWSHRTEFYRKLRIYELQLVFHDYSSKQKVKN